MKDSLLYAEKMGNVVSKKCNKQIEEIYSRLLDIDEINKLSFKTVAVRVFSEIMSYLSKVMKYVYLREVWEAQRRTGIEDMILDEETLLDILINSADIEKTLFKNFDEWERECKYIIKSGRDNHLPRVEIEALLRRATGTIGESGITYKVMRILRTEANRTVNKAAIKAYTDYGVQSYQYHALFDDRTCEECQELNGTIIPIDRAKEGENIPPLHPNCRCYITPVGVVKFKIRYTDWQSQYVIER